MVQQDAAACVRLSLGQSHNKPCLAASVSAHKRCVLYSRKQRGRRCKLSHIASTHVVWYSFCSVKETLWAPSEHVDQLFCINTSDPLLFLLDLQVNIIAEILLMYTSCHSLSLGSFLSFVEHSLHFREQGVERYTIAFGGMN